MHFTSNFGSDIRYVARNSPTLLEKRMQIHWKFVLFLLYQGEPENIAYERGKDKAAQQHGIQYLSGRIGYPLGTQRFIGGDDGSDQAAYN